ncbi:MAG: zinc-binding dehydrogenase [SAR202 cluster bacterium]|nr:zinc-binding dehydrogenase [SAR202 cluster bacterium]
MSTMKACVYKNAGVLSIGDVPIPTPGPGDVLVKTGAASLCFSDIRVYKGEKSATPNVTLGHEVAGTIVEIGSDVSGLSIGDRVTACPIVSCGACEYCQMGKQNRCQNRTTLGYDHDGGIAEYVLLPKQLVDIGHLLKIPKDVPFDIACQNEPFACALYSLETCKVKAGTNIAIIGAGPMGLTHLILAKHLGATNILVIDQIDERLTAAKNLGATQTLNHLDEETAANVLKKANGVGFDAVIVTVGNAEVIEASVHLARKQGWINIFGGSPPSSKVSLDPNLIHYNELFVTGTQNAPVDHYKRSLRLLTEIQDEIHAMVTHEFHIENAIDAFTARTKMDGLKAVIKFDK